MNLNWKILSPRGSTSAVKADAPLKEAEFSAPWLSPTVLPDNPMGNDWGVLWDGKVESIGLDSLLALVRQGPGATQWNGKTERNPVVFVAVPGVNRIIPLAECAEFQPMIIELNGSNYQSDRSKNGRIFYPLAAICVALALFGHGREAFLPAFYATGAGTAHFEAWVALRKLRMHPSEYLKSLAAEARYAYWQQAGGKWADCRTFCMVGAWLLITAVQAFMVFTTSSKEPRPDIIAAALIKPLVHTQPWRLLTGPMLHGSIMHILMNAMAMLSLGSILERSAHRNLLAPVWLLGALSGSLLSWITLPADSVGASGGLMGLFGFLLVMVWRRRALMPPDFLQSLLRSLLAMAMLGILAQDIIDNAAHLGGLLAGGLLGIWVFREPEGSLPLQDTTMLRTIGVFSETLFIGLAVFTLLKLIQ